MQRVIFAMMIFAAPSLASEASAESFTAAVLAASPTSGLTGTEVLPIIQGGVTRQDTLSDVTAFIRSKVSASTLSPGGNGSLLTGITAAQVGALAPNGSGADLTGITASQVGALPIKGGSLEGSISAYSFVATSFAPQGNLQSSAPTNGTYQGSNPDGFLVYPALGPFSGTQTAQSVTYTTTTGGAGTTEFGHLNNSVAATAGYHTNLGLFTLASANAGPTWAASFDLQGPAGASPAMTTLELDTRPYTDYKGASTTFVGLQILGGGPGRASSALAVGSFDASPSTANFVNGILFGAAINLISDNTIFDASDSNVSYNDAGSHTVGWNLQGDYSAFQVYGKGWNVNPTGVGTFSGLVVDQGGGIVEPLMTPASSSATCTAGQFADDTDYHYVCVASSKWRRAALSDF